MKVNTTTLLNELTELTQHHINQAQALGENPLARINKKAEENTWSALECIEHLNLYGDYYLPEIEKRMHQSNTKPDTYFKSGLLGGYFAKSMLPKEKLNTMKTFKDKNPNGSVLDKSTLDRFINQQEKMLELLDMAQQVSLNKTKTGISISKWVKLKLGDTFKVVIYHNKRHMLQAVKALEH